MLDLLPANQGICLQGEDEIASIGFCIGASMAGLRVMTATSGPGISLFSEQISFAIGSEVPLVIVDVQRLGPSTGSATKGADSDIQFLRWGNSGGLPVIVLAPVDAVDCYNLTRHAFNLADTYRCPVFIASNKEIGMTRESVPVESFHNIETLTRSAGSPGPQDGSRLPFHTLGGSKVAPFLPMGGKTLVRQTSSSHGPDGYITSSTEVIGETIRRMRDKLIDHRNDLNFYRLDEESGSDALLIAYGVTARAASVGVRQLRNESMAISLLVLNTLYPVPEEVLKSAINKVSRIFVVEMNLGQYVREIERLSGTKPVRFFGKMNGELITPDEICRFIES